MSTAILPGATIGVLGSGQLGRMFAIAARRMGYRVQVLSPDDDTPTGQVADVEMCAAYDDPEAVRQFAESVDVVTFEFENVPAATIDLLGDRVPVRPGGRVLNTTQHRLREKQFLRAAGLPVTPFEAVRNFAELQTEVARGSCPAVLKTAAWGYDGKGQVLLKPETDLAAAWQQLGTDEAVLEQFIDFECELSVVAARGVTGQLACYEPVLNKHVNHILDVTVSPAELDPRVAARAVEIAGEVLRVLDVQGVLCVEFFLAQTGELLINELAPRPHNSGHATINSHVTCQFEQQVRAVCGLPLGSTRQLRPAAMANLLGDLWTGGEPDWEAVCAMDDVKLHLYGKRAPRVGRKMGHLTALADSAEAAEQRVRGARAALAAGGP